MLIIGGGSAGLFTAIKRAQQLQIEQTNNQQQTNNSKNFENITIIEEHKSLGLPVQCTGILTDSVHDFFSNSEIKKFTINKINKTTIHSENNTLNLKLNNNIIIDNVKFVEFLENKTDKLNINILTNHKYIHNNIQKNSINIRNTITKELKILKTSSLIGADGPLSLVAKNNELTKYRKNLLGMQKRIKLTDDINSIEFHTNVGEYAWCVPEGNGTARIGVALKLSNPLNNKIFNDFLKKYPGKTIETQAGLIPLHHPREKIIRTYNSSTSTRTSSKSQPYSKSQLNVALVGDAALQIKNTTGGGIIPGLKASEALSFGIDNYTSNLKKLNKELYFHYLIHQILSKYSSKDFDRLLNKIKNEKIKTLLENTNRDNLSKLILLLASKPSMIAEGLYASTKIRHI
ncbi:MAG: NAD(P)/FAD-dependent oxidoreductase [Candidatus Woesearchaeota archaeon]|jgi:flavin-dependent dehydrogenase